MTHENLSGAYNFFSGGGWVLWGRENFAATVGGGGAAESSGGIKSLVG